MKLNKELKKVFLSLPYDLQNRIRCDFEDGYYPEEKYAKQADGFWHAV